MLSPCSSTGERWNGRQEEDQSRKSGGEGEVAQAGREKGTYSRPRSSHTRRQPIPRRVRAKRGAGMRIDQAGDAEDRSCSRACSSEPGTAVRLACGPALSRPRASKLHVMLDVR